MQTLLDAAKHHHLTPLQTVQLQRLADCSPFIARLLIKDADLLADLLTNLHISYSVAHMQLFLTKQTIIDEQSLKKALRQLRQHVFARMITRDINDLATLNEVMQTTSHLAEICLQTAVSFSEKWLQALFNKPLSASQQLSRFIIVGMGKLGGQELNVSSDIDLIFAYEAVDEQFLDISQQDFYTALGKKVIAALDEITEDGFVFRVDMRLRPFGSEGALVSNLDALEEYYQNNGREWERYAWIKGRVVVGPQAKITELLKPFIYRKYLDFGAFASMRDVKLQIHRDVLQKGLGDNIKLGRGGIREIEFIAQVFQLIRGGRDKSLQIKPTLTVLNALKNIGLLPIETAGALIAAYSFLRNIEHRLMYVEDQQTQNLPKTSEAQARLANAMYFEDWPTFLVALNRHRAIVASHFDATFADEMAAPNSENSTELSTETSIWQNTRAENDALQALFHAGYSGAAETYALLQRLRKSQRYQQLPELSRQRFDALMPLVIAQCGAVTNADEALLRAVTLLEAICRRASYLALLAEYPRALQLLIKLCAASPWLAQYLTAHPILLDELLDTQTLYAAPDFAAMKTALTQKMHDLAGDAEAQMDAMRHFKHTTTLRFAAQDLAGKLPLETLSDYLSALADTILQVSLPTIWQHLKQKHRDIPQFAIIGFGKLGGKELGYVSDLDIIFLFEDESEGASEVYAKFAQRINNWFNSQTNAGLLYETDLQLRPDGNSGLLVSALDAFKEYQHKRAWIWEHQAMTRARFVAGDERIGVAFEAIRIEVMQQNRDVQKLKKEVIEMREKIHDANINKGELFDVKHDEGGIIDVEFIVQYLGLAQAAQYIELTHNFGNIALLTMHGKLNIIDAILARKVANAYRNYRRLQHAARLQGNMQAVVPFQAIENDANAVKLLWHQVFKAVSI